MTREHENRPIVGIVADDLTGALDASAPFAARGFDTRVLLDDARDAPAEVLVVSTESRDHPIHAAERASAAARRLLAAGVQLLFKKIDSTMRGSVAVEIASVLETMPSDSIALVCPAHPAAGRVVVGGHVRVTDGGAGDGIDIPSLLPRSSPHGPEADAAGARIRVADASTAAELGELVGWAQEQAGPVLLVGSGGLASALAARLSAARESWPVLIVVGSRHARSREQIAAAEATVLSLPLARIDEEGAWERICTDARARASRALLITTDIAADKADRIERRLSAAAAAVVRTGVAGLVLTGGATARAVLDALGAQAIDVQGELRAGVPHGRIRGGGVDGMRIVTKAGGFGDTDILRTAIAMIRDDDDSAHHDKGTRP